MTRDELLAAAREAARSAPPMPASALARVAALLSGGGRDG